MLRFLLSRCASAALAALVSSLIATGLADEIFLYVNPTAIGAGMAGCGS